MLISDMQFVFLRHVMFLRNLILKFYAIRAIFLYRNIFFVFKLIYQAFHNV